MAGKYLKNTQLFSLTVLFLLPLSDGGDLFLKYWGQLGGILMGTNDESLEHDPRSVSSLFSLDSSSTTPGKETNDN